MNEHLKYIKELAQRDGRYKPEAFLFISEAINMTAEWLRSGVIKENDIGEDRGEEHEFHVSGKELLTGIRMLAGQRWGNMAKTIFNSWNVYKTDDFGEIVFCMVNDEKMNWQKRECDTLDDFINGYDFDTAFNKL